MPSLLRLPSALLSRLLIALVRLYQRTAGRYVRAPGRRLCRFSPSCSAYFILAVEKHGPIAGARKGIARICRCNSWNRGGHDPP